MNKDDAKRLSRFLSLVLRHEPEAAGLALDAQGWASVAALMASAQANGFSATLEDLRHVVETSEKKRFAFSPDHLFIRAQQGHSVEVDLDLAPAAPPAVLYHGTVDRFLTAIVSEGLKKGARHHVHLSADIETAERVGARRGEPVVLRVDAASMAAAGFVFFVSGNGVWLTDHVPANYVATGGT